MPTDYLTNKTRIRTKSMSCFCMIHLKVSKSGLTFYTELLRLPLTTGSQEIDLHILSHQVFQLQMRDHHNNHSIQTTFLKLIPF